MRVNAAGLRLFGIAFACILFFGVCAYAQPASNRAIIAKNSCKDAFGTNVVLEYVRGAENALLLNGRPVVLLDASVINSEPIQMAEFLYFSECAHHVLGHVLKAASGAPIAPADGLYADCWALRFLQRNSGYGPADTALLLKGLAGLRVPGYAYPQGLQRANNLKTCP